MQSFSRRLLALAGAVLAVSACGGASSSRSSIQTVCQFGIAPGEAEIVDAKKASSITGITDLKGKNLGVTDLGSGTQTVTSALLGQKGVSADQAEWVAVGAGNTFIAAITQQRIDAGMTT